MGSWGPRTFQNDTAMDWLQKLHGTEDMTLVRRTLVHFAEPPQGSSQSGNEEEALAAAEIVASWLGHPPPGKEGLDKWVRKHMDWFTVDILELAQQTVAAIKIKSKLRDMWTDRDGAVRTDWLDSVADLEQRLQS